MTPLRPLILSLLASASLALPACSGGSDGGATTTPIADGETLKTASPPTMPKPEVIGETLATVNGMPVGTKEFDALALRSKGRQNDLDAAARQEVMDRLVEEKLLYQAALAQGIDKDPKIQKMMVNTLLKQEVYASVRTSDISEDDLRAYFTEHQDEFVVPEKVQIKRIVVEPERDKGQAPADASEAAWAAAQARVEHDFRRCLGASDGHRALMALADLCSLCARHCRRPILRHDVRCRCLGSDEACFANFVAAAATGDHEDAMLIATLLVRADMAPSLTGLAATLGHALMRIAVSDVPAGATVH